jgi:hypothetical protein
VSAQSCTASLELPLAACAAQSETERAARGAVSGDNVRLFVILTQFDAVRCTPPPRATHAPTLTRKRAEAHALTVRRARAHHKLTGRASTRPGGRCMRRAYVLSILRWEPKYIVDAAAWLAFVLFLCWNNWLIALPLTMPVVLV